MAEWRMEGAETVGSLFAHHSPRSTNTQIIVMKGDMRAGPGHLPGQDDGCADCLTGIGRAARTL
jgi:hypothetical protein